jgi:ABC-type bacteriocin/lantibiotic exporter with double-glycine peptidase domain
MTIYMWQQFGPVRERPTPSAFLVRQWSPTTCGPAAVATVLNAYRVQWNLRALEEECVTCAQGSSLHALQEACRRRGLQAQGLRATSSRALMRVPRPYVSYVKPGHYIVVIGVLHNSLEVFDPSSGLTTFETPEELFGRNDGWILAIGARGLGRGPLERLFINSER